MDMTSAKCKKRLQCEHQQHFCSNKKRKLTTSEENNFILANKNDTVESSATNHHLYAKSSTTNHHLHAERDTAAPLYTVKGREVLDTSPNF
ncbi:10789_t:CDS:1, partial [Racocetra persica]